MKKIILILVIALFAADLSYGQFALGIKIGYNANKLSTNVDSIKSSFNSGFHIGIFSRFGKRLYVAPELQYTMSGAVFSNEGNLTTKGWSEKITIGTLDIPVMIGFKIIHSDFITWRIELGPQASFVVNKKIKEQGDIAGPVKDANINSANWYILGGTGIDFLFLKLDIRYQYGLNQLITDVQSIGSSSSTYDARNQMFVVSLGWKIFGKK
jgi:hypothetical protein